MAGHTKGPWKVTWDERGEIVRTCDATGRPIASMWLNGDDPKANARLIAAAPDLLAALEDCALQIAQTRNRKLTDGEQFALDSARTALHLAKHGAA